MNNKNTPFIINIIYYYSYFSPQKITNDDHQEGHLSCHLPTNFWEVGVFFSSGGITAVIMSIIINCYYLKKKKKKINVSINERRMIWEVEEKKGRRRRERKKIPQIVW